MGPNPTYHLPKGERCETLVEHGLRLWAEPDGGYCSRRLVPFSHMGEPLYGGT